VAASGCDSLTCINMATAHGDNVLPRFGTAWKKPPPTQEVGLALVGATLDLADPCWLRARVTRTAPTQME